MFITVFTRARYWSLSLVQINPLYNIPSYFFTIKILIIFYLRLGFPSDIFLQISLLKPVCAVLPCVLHAIPMSSCHYHSNISISTLFSNTFILPSPLKVRDQVSHPHKTKGKITVLYILTFTFLDIGMEDRCFWTEWQKESPKFYGLLISLWRKFWSVNIHSKIFELCHIFKGSVSYLSFDVGPHSGG
jgi:hypothetical protein